MKKHIAISLRVGLSVACAWTWMSLLSQGVAASAEKVPQRANASSGAVVRVAGDTPCPSGYVPASAQEARANVGAICRSLGGWSIVRLAGGGSIDGPNYGCGIRDYDDRGLGHSLCKKVDQFTIGIGDAACPSNYTVVSPLVARANHDAICDLLGTWYIARLADGGSMDGPGYGCAIRDEDTRGLGHTVCAAYSFAQVVGDSPCGPGRTLLTPEEARARRSEVCAKLGQWDIARLEGGGSMDGPGYGCGIRDLDTRSLGHSVCKVL